MATPIFVLLVVNNPRRMLLLERVHSLNSKRVVCHKLLHTLAVLIKNEKNNVEVGNASQLVRLLHQILLALALLVQDALALVNNASGSLL